MKLNNVLKAAAITALAAGVANAEVLDDMKTKSEAMIWSNGKGAWTFDIDAPSGGTSTVTIKNADGNYYEAAKGIENIDDCPRGGAEEDGVMKSSCYWGWNHKDAYTQVDGKDALLSTWTVNGYVDPNVDWPWASAGIYALFDYNTAGTGDGAFANSRPGALTMGSSISFDFKYTDGKAITLSLYDPANDGNKTRPKMKLTGSGAWKNVNIGMSDFTLPDWEKDATLAPSAIISKVIAIGILREEAATTKGAAFDATAQGGARDFAIASLSGEGIYGDVSNETATSVQKASFSALQNGLQFRNVNKELNVQIFNTMGQAVKAQKVNAKNLFVSTESLKNGVYIVRAADGAGLNLMQNITIMK